ncbi:hypothetical protein BB561_006982 [Smittium simulii]|uniref:Uncharacterized protein n=1 Tax=Smittium simulii TaxID=133385 RepID=A0A2T9XYC5_9FUNG|nr:hypothetical protein BB561_006982 [Smittium simulii]
MVIRASLRLISAPKFINVEIPNNNNSCSWFSNIYSEIDFMHPYKFTSTAFSTLEAVLSPITVLSLISAGCSPCNFNLYTSFFEIKLTAAPLSYWKVEGCPWIVASPTIAATSDFCCPGISTRFIDSCFIRLVGVEGS